MTTALLMTLLPSQIFAQLLTFSVIMDLFLVEVSQYKRRKLFIPGKHACRPGHLLYDIIPCVINMARCAPSKRLTDPLSFGASDQDPAHF